MSKGKRNVRQQKNKKKVEKQIEQMNNFKDNKSKVFIIILSVLAFLSIFYLLTVYITNKDDDSSVKEKEETSIQYEEILAGSSFDMNEKEYLVVYYDKTNAEVNEALATKITEYKNKQDAKALYIVDLSNSFNKEAVSKDDSNSKPSDASELAVSEPTLIEFKEGKVTNYIEGVDSIEEYLS